MRMIAQRTLRFISRFRELADYPLMNGEKELGPLALIAGVFATFYCLPLGWPRFDRAAQEALALTK